MNQVEISNDAVLTQHPPLTCNWDAIAKLEAEYRLLMKGWLVPGDVPTIARALTTPLIEPGTSSKRCSAQWTQWRLVKVTRLLELMKPLMKRFELNNVEIYPLIPADEMNPIDLFIRFPKVAHLVISIRSKGETGIVYNEAREELIVKKRHGKTNKWEPNPLVELADYKSWLVKNRWRFKMTSREATKTSTAKVLALCLPTIVCQHRSELYSEMGTLKPLVLRRKGAAFVIQESNLVDLTAAWLDRCTQPGENNG